jgi:CBS-domain-containing membrane protein
MPALTAGPDESLTEVAGRLAEGKLGALPVVDHGKLVGLVTISDVLDAEVPVAMGPSSSSQATAADAMSP